jgi:pimeloyl-ACP methyl ester carboxylesterase
VFVNNTTTLHRAAAAILLAAMLSAGCDSSNRPNVAIDKTAAVPSPSPAAVVKTANYASVNGLNMYYEVHGTGRPLVLLHGAFTTIESAWDKLLPELAKNRQVIAIEQQGHGHTADIDRPFSYEQMAEDTAELLRQLKVEEVDVVGWSMGGTTALRLAIQHPGLVRKLMVVGCHYSNRGWVPEQLEGFKNLPADFAPKELKEPYDKVAPNPSQWPSVIAKFKRAAVNFQGWRPEEMKSIKAHTVVIVGDRDIYLPEHAVQMFRLIPQAQLAVLPDTDHFAVWTRPDWMVQTIKAFFDAPIPKAK